MSGEAFGLVGKTAVVTGGASGIGKAIVEAFVRAGAMVHILDVDGPAAEAAAGSVSGPAGPPAAHAVDVSDGNAVAAVFDEITGRGFIDILVNNAGIAHIGNVETTTEEDMDRLFAVNVKGMYHCTHAAIGAMKERGGVILNMASVAASSGIADRFAYSMTKGAVLAMTLSIAKDYAKHGIRCVSISPARIHTPFVDGYLAEHYPGREEEMFKKLSATQPIGRMGSPREVADLAVYLCSDEAAFATGTDYPIDGGFLKLNS
jgi:NAD(P)-dependent dehydrogenase (short-subunit alcohol dehydrogenase family)